MHTLNRATSLAFVGVLTLATSLHAQSFDILFRLSGVKGSCQVKKPDAAAFEPAINGKAYPFGTTVRTGPDGETFLLLSPDDSLHMLPQGELSVFEPEGTMLNSNRVIRLTEGRLEISMRDNLVEKSLVIDTPVASCDSFVGRSRLELSKFKKPTKGMLDLLMQVRTENGSVRIYGPQFSVPKMKSGSAARIESSVDRSMTRIVNESNDYQVNIENGTDAPVVMETSTRSTVRICREHAAVGGKLVVSVLETAPDGKGKGNFAFVLGEPSLSASGLPTLADGLTGSVFTATAPGGAGTATNLPLNRKEESLFQ
ncbi:MAG: hypothetical protein ACOYOU_16910 [Kiritimatiellia bacterium]